jgi:hypothetical protein
MNDISSPSPGGLGVRHYCRNCRMKLETDRRAFCCRGCHESFYRRRCLVCEKELSKGPANRKLCKRAACRAEYRRFPHLYLFAGNVQRPLETPIKSGTETRVVAGRISPTALRLASLPLDPATEARIRRANARVWDAAAIIGPNNAPINLIGGYRFANAPHRIAIKAQACP